MSIDYLWYSFEIPWRPILISILAILLVTIISTIYLKKKIFVDDLMDILKKEGIHYINAKLSSSCGAIISYKGITAIKRRNFYEIQSW